MINVLERARGAQIDFHQPPVWVEGGDEKHVLVVRARHVSSSPMNIEEISSFLGVMPGDIVEAAVDVVDIHTQRVFYTRSLHKEAAGIYEAWDRKTIPTYVPSRGFEVVITCRVNDYNRDKQLKAFFEGLVRVEVS